jgi:hypothetical protein
MTVASGSVPGETKASGSVPSSPEPRTEALSAGER